jgi:BirA family biotin operon repressor/biotin-[acetyl-CoA-carboxylase] ligase
VIHIVDRVSSTNTWLSSNSTGGNDCIIALQQTRGKGRGVRVWESPPGGLYLSIISPSHSLLPLIAGISVIQTLVGLDNRLRLKWPNDIILDGKKVGGILCEGDGKHAVAGIGINLNNSPSFPNSTNLASIGYDLDEYRFLKSFFMIFRENLQKSNQDIISRFRDYDCLLGRDISWGKATGIAKSINSDGSLEVLSDGKLVNLYSGDVHLE